MLLVAVLVLLIVVSSMPGLFEWISRFHISDTANLRFNSRAANTGLNMLFIYLLIITPEVAKADTVLQCQLVLSEWRFHAADCL